MRRVLVAMALLACSMEEGPYGQREPAPAKVAEPTKVAESTKVAEPTPSAPESEAPEAVRVDAKPDAVTVVDAGAQPRQALRYTPRVGDEQRIELRMKSTLAITIGVRDIPNTPMPDVIVALSHRVTSVGDTIDYAFTVEEARRSEGEFSERVTKAVDQAIEAMRATKGTLGIDARGIARHTTIESPELPTPELHPSFTGFQQSFGQLYPSLPDEPIGVGAKWNAISHFDLGGVPIEQEATYTLLRRDGDEIELAVAFTQSATSQVTRDGEIQMNVTAFGGRGEGTVTLHLGRVAPLKGSARSRSVTVTTLQAAERQNVTMDMTLDLKIEGRN